MYKRNLYALEAQARFIVRNPTVHGDPYSLSTRFVLSSPEKLR